VENIDEVKINLDNNVPIVVVFSSIKIEVKVNWRVVVDKSEHIELDTETQNGIDRK
jgi:hypothetical protein